MSVPNGLLEFVSVLQAQDVRFVFEVGRGGTAAVYVVAAGFAGAVTVSLMWIWLYAASITWFLPS